MPKYDTSAPQESTTQEWHPLETGEYTMKIAGAKVAPSIFEDEDGNHREELTLTWELAEWTPEYDDASYQPGQKVFQRMPPWYGVSKTRGDSKFKQFIDQLRKDNLIPTEFWIAGAEDADNQGDLIGITRRVMVEKYIKQQGKNAGQPGNRVLAISPLKKHNGSNAPSPPQHAPTPSQAMTTFNKPAASEPDLPWNPTDSPERADLISEAQTLAKECGGFWLRKRFEEEPDEEIQHMIGRMQNYLKRSASDPNEELFPA